ncbi:MAG: UDP-N-acetylmuramoyl-tripeptide--D-alanyl-D-alanine ligase [Pseudomonadota bacterium]
MIPVKMSLEALERPLGGKLSGPDVMFSRIGIDTRTLQPGDLYLALRGEHFDGSDFIADAKHRGAAGAIVERIDADCGMGQLLVDDGLEALRGLGRMCRAGSDARFLAITGSQGKTTVKEMVGAICGAQDQTLVTRGNLNNDVGVPLTLLDLLPSHRFAVIELGASAVGDIARTVALVQPDAGLITNAAATHVEGFGSLAGVVQGKGEIIDGTLPGGTVVLNADDPACETWRKRAGERTVVTFGVDDTSADVKAENIVLYAGGSRFELITPDAGSPVRLSLPGRHNIANALAAAALAHSAGIRDTSIVEGLERVRPVRGRLSTLQSSSGCQLLDDSYNASPSSFREAVEVLMSLATESGLAAVAIMGEMAELGDEAAALHRQAGAYARERGVSRLWATGPHAEDWCAGFDEAGARVFGSIDQVIRYASTHLDDRHVALVKGSRSAGMERVVEALQSGREVN